MSKETKARVANAFRAMKSIGISEDKVKPVLKNLLKLYDKNWELIEVENYRALADAIFEREEVQAAECLKKTMNNEAAEHPKKKEDCLEEEALATEESERPLKRLRHRYRDGQTSNSNTSNTSVPRTPLLNPKEEPEQPASHMLQFNGLQGIEESPQPSAESERVKSQPITCQSHGPNKGKQLTSPISLMVNESCEPCKPSSIDGIEQNTTFRTETRSTSHPMRLRDRGRRSVSPQSRGKRSVPESSSDAACPNESNIERDIVLSPKKKSVFGHTLIKPKDEPITDDIMGPEVPIAVSHPGLSSKGNSSCMNGTIGDDEGTELSASLSIDKIDDTATANDLRNNADALGATGLNGSVDLQLDTEVPNTLLLPPPCNGMDDGSHLNKMVTGDDGGTNIENQENCAGETDDVRCAAVLHHQVAPETIRSLNDVIDIAKGLEKVVITLVNEVNDESPPSFFYIPQNAVFQNAYLNFSLARMGDNNCCSTCVGDCLSLSSPCACAHETGGEFAYTADGLVKEEFLNECISMNRDPKKHCQFFCKECALERSKNEDVIEPCKGHLVRKFIKECWWKCGCNKQCGNRVVQRGISRNLQVFMTPEGKGWGLRTLEDLPKGAFVCEYVGEVLTNAELFDRVSRGAKGEKHSYPVLLDADWAAEEVLKDEEALCLDATYYGNVARFINHKCYDSNMVEIPVEVETPDHHYYHLAFFTTRKVKAMEELTWDYGIDFDDHDHPIKAFSCQCGSKFCRNIKRSSRSRSSRR